MSYLNNTQMEAPFLLDLALGDPTNIEDSIRVLRLAGRTSVRAAIIVQNAFRNWLRSVEAAITIQSAVRQYQLRCKQEKKILQNRAASIIQAFYRIYSIKREVGNINETFTSAFGISNNIPNIGWIADEKCLTCTSKKPETNQENDNLEKVSNKQGKDEGSHVAMALWKFAKERGIFCITEKEAEQAQYRDRGVCFDARILVPLISDPEVDIDTKILSSFLLGDFFWTAVEMNNMNILPPDFMRSIESMCIKNITSKNWGIFRGAVRILAELWYLQEPSRNSFSSDMLEKLLNFLRLIFTLSEHPVFDSFSTSLPSRNCRLAWGTHVGYDIIRMVEQYFSRLPWDQRPECQYLKTVVLVWADGTQARYRARFVAHNLWDEWPIGDIVFHKFLRDSVRAIIKSTNKLERLLLEMIALYLLNGIQHISMPVNVQRGSKIFTIYTYYPEENDVALSCACMAKLLEEIFVAAHSCNLYFSSLIDTIQKDFCIDCFAESPSNNATRFRGVFFGCNVLRPVFDLSALSFSLNESLSDTQQLTALYILRGLSYEELVQHVKMDVYLSAICRFPDTLLGAWFHRRVNPVGFKLENFFAHCAVSIDNEECIGMYGGDLNLLVEYKKKNTLLHTAAFYGSENVLRLLIERGMQPTIQNIDGDSPLSIARRRKNTDCITILKNVLINDNVSIDNLVTTINTGDALASVGAINKRQKNRKKTRKKQKSKNPPPRS